MTGHDASAHAPSGHGGPEAVHPKELEFDEQVRKDRHTAAMRLQGIVRARQAFMKVNERKKKKREMLPAQDEHGHANPATIRYWTPAPMVHIHHHGTTSTTTTIVLHTILTHPLLFKLSRLLVLLQLFVFSIGL